MTKLTVRNCELCNASGEDVVWRDDFCRIVRVADAEYPGFCRVILNQHVSEMTELEPLHRDRLMRAVFATETALRELMKPDKINLASFGNMVPHVHWHVVPRYRDDRHFPNPVWGQAEREGISRLPPSPQDLSARLERALGPAAKTVDPS